MQILSITILLLWLLAFVRTLINLRLIPRLSPNAIPSATPLVSIVIPARNEARVIENTVRAFLAQDYPNFKLIVVDDRSTDGTGEILESIGDPRLMVVHGQEPPGGWLGKPWALEQGTARARGELFLIVDADLIYSPPAVRAAVAELQRNDAAMLTLLPHFEMVTFGERVAMPMLAFAVFSILPTWYSNRSSMARLALGGGSGNLIRRTVFQAVGGFGALRDAVVDDLALGRAVRHRRERTLSVRADDLIHVRMYHGGKEIVDGFTKNIFYAVGRSFVLGTLLFALLLVGHLMPYVLAAAGDRISIATVAVITGTRLVLFRSLRYGLFNALFLHPLMIAFWAWILLRSMWITGVRKELRWRGRTYDTAQTRFGAE